MNEKKSSASMTEMPMKMERCGRPRGNGISHKVIDHRRRIVEIQRRAMDESQNGALPGMVQARALQDAREWPRRA